MKEPGEAFRSGFVSLVGAPNAGKSTLLNALAGTKLAIVSSKPQTTRTSVQGIVTAPEYQIIFADTPGIHQSASLINQRMMQSVRTALDDRDLILLVADCSRRFDSEDQFALDMIKPVQTKVFLVLNKIDRVEDKNELLPRLDQYRTQHEFAEYYPVSALTGEGLDLLREAIVGQLPEGPQYFPEGTITDQPERFLAAEFIREQILEATRQEVPHSVAVVVDSWQDTPKLVRIAATIYVERPGHKAIIIGAKGAMLKTIGTEARRAIENLLGRKVFLEMFVKVVPDWREKPEHLEVIDWRSMRGGESEDTK